MISVLLYRQFIEKTVLVTLGTVFGILCGIFQVIEFIRWPILIPYLAQAQQTSPEMVAFVEGALTILVALEPLAPMFSILGELTNPVISAWYIWLVYLAISLLRSQPEDDNAPKFGFISLILSVITWMGFVLPAYL